jgi:hypothetical protein
MVFFRGKRRFDVRPHAQRINRTFEPFRASSGRGFTVRRHNRLPMSVRLGFWTGCTLVALWSLAMVAGQQPGPGQAAAAEVAQYRW